MPLKLLVLKLGESVSTSKSYKYRAALKEHTTCARELSQQRYQGGRVDDDDAKKD